MRSIKVILLIVSLSVLVSFGGYFLIYRNFLGASSGKAFITVYSDSTKPFDVTLNGKQLGETPLQNVEVPPGDDQVLQLNDSSYSYKTKVKLTRGTRTVVKWGVGPTETFSEGEILWFEKGSKKGTAPLLVISDPDEVEVRIDGTLIGLTPLSTSDITPGERELSLSKTGYRSRSVSLNLEEGYQLNVKSKLFLLPYLEKNNPRIEYLEDARYQISDFSSGNPELLLDTSSWVKGLVYLVGQESGNAESFPFDYFLDYRGQFYDAAGVKIAESSEVDKKLEKAKISYLGKQGEGLSAEAKDSLKLFSDKVFLVVDKIEILSTPTGWLRVRESPSTSAKEIGRLNKGEIVYLLGTSGSWYKIKSLDGTLSGFISATYGKIIKP